MRLSTFRNLVVVGPGLTSPAAIARAKELFETVSFVNKVNEVDLSSIGEGDVAWIHLDSLISKEMARAIGEGGL